MFNAFKSTMAAAGVPMAAGQSKIAAAAIRSALDELSERQAKGSLDLKAAKRRSAEVVAARGTTDKQSVHFPPIILRSSWRVPCRHS